MDWLMDDPDQPTIGPKEKSWFDYLDPGIHSFLQGTIGDPSQEDPEKTGGLVGLATNAIRHPLDTGKSFLSALAPPVLKKALSDPTYRMDSPPENFDSATLGNKVADYLPIFGGQAQDAAKQFEAQTPDEDLGTRISRGVGATAGVLSQVVGPEALRPSHEEVPVGPGVESVHPVNMEKLPMENVGDFAQARMPDVRKSNLPFENVESLLNQPEYERLDNMTQEAVKRTGKSLEPRGITAKPGETSLDPTIYGENPGREVKINLVNHVLDSPDIDSFVDRLSSTIQHELAHDDRIPHDKVGVDNEGSRYYIGEDRVKRILPDSTSDVHSYEERGQYTPNEHQFVNNLDLVKHDPETIATLEQLRNNLKSNPEIFENLKQHLNQNRESFLEDRMLAEGKVNPLGEELPPEEENIDVSQLEKELTGDQPPTLPQEPLIENPASIESGQGGLSVQESVPGVQESVQPGGPTAAEPPTPITPKAQSFVEFLNNKYGDKATTVKERAIARAQWEKEKKASAEPPVPTKKQVGPKQPNEYLDFPGWVNARKASPLEGAEVRQRFSKLDEGGIDNVVKYQEGKLSPEDTATVKNETDKILEEARRAGIKIDYKDTYLHQMWQDPPEVVQQKMGRIVKQPGFSLESTFSNYKEGLDAGLTPKYKTVSEILGVYREKVSKAIADRKFINYLKDNSLIKPSGAAPEGWKTINPDIFSAISISKGKSINWKAPAEVARQIENHLQAPDNILSKIASKASDVKNVVMSSGIPFTGLNAHGISTLGRAFLTGEGPIRGVAGAAHAAQYLFNPKLAREFVTKNLSEGARFVKSGLQLNVEEHGFRPEEKNLGQIFSETKGEFGYKKLRAIHEHIFERPLFNEIIPALKIEKAKAIEERLLKSGIDPAEATKIAAHQANDAFGGINIDEIARDKNTQNFLRATLNAPDWLESNFNLAKGVAKSILDPNNPRGKMYLDAVKNLGAYFAAKYAVQSLLNKKDTKNVDEFNLPAGKKDSRITRQVKPLGTGGDFARIPYDIAKAVFTKKPGDAIRVVYNRLNPLSRLGVDLLKNKDFAGRAIFSSKNEKVKPMKSLGRVVKEAADVAAPQYISAPVEWGSGDITGEEAVSKALEFPLTYSREKKKSASEDF